MQMENIMNVAGKKISVVVRKNSGGYSDPSLVMYLMFRFSLGNKRIGKVSLHALWCYDVIFRKQIGTFGLSALMFCVVQREAE